MIIFREFDFDINLFSGFFADQLVFKTGDKGTGTEFQRIVIAFAALKFNSVNRTGKVNNNSVTFD